LFIFMLIMFYPFWYVLILSLNNNNIIGNMNVYFYPKAFTIQNYQAIFRSTILVRAYTISLIRTIIGTVISVIGNGAIAYALAKKYLVGRKVILALVLITMYFSGGIIPLYLLLKNLGMINRIWALVVPYLFSAWYIILMKTYFAQLPESLEESAKIDGANDIAIFAKIVFPTSLPIFSTIALFVAVFHWNDWFAGDMYIMNPKLQPIQTVLMQILNEMKTNQLISSGVIVNNDKANIESVKMASMVLTILPIVMIYPLLQKYFIKGIMIGSIKG
jgi:putative aldouronate transport system permease protein